MSANCTFTQCTMDVCSSPSAFNNRCLSISSNMQNNNKKVKFKITIEKTDAPLETNDTCITSVEKFSPNGD